MTQPFYSYERFYSSSDQLPRESHTDFPLDRFLRRANADPTNISYLQNLRKVYIIADEASLADDDRHYIAIDLLDCTTLFDHLPSIESISTDAVIEGENHCSRLVPRSSNISRFHLNHCALDSTYLAYLAQSSKELKEFQYTMGGRAVGGGHFLPFDVRVFIKSISPYNETLEVIDIDAEGNTFYLEPEHFEDDRIDEELELRGLLDIDFEHLGDEKNQFLRSFWENTGSLKDFRALKRLSMGIGLLMYFAMGIKEGEGPRKPINLWEELPESLEYLCIRGYERGLYDKWDAQIDSLLKFVDSGSSRIKVIKGIEEMIPNSRDLNNPDNEEDSLWTLKGAGLEF